MSTGRLHHCGHLVQVWKESLQPLTLYISFHDLINVYSRRSGADNPRRQNFDVNSNLLSLRSFATSFKNISLKSDFIQFLNSFMHVYSPRAGADNPLGTKLWCQQEHLVTSVICCKFKKNLFEAWFYTTFFMILYMYIAPGQWQTAPQGTKFWCQQKCLVTSLICCKFQKKCLWSLILYNFFHDLIHVYSPDAGTDSPWGQNFDVNWRALSLYPLSASFK